MKAYDVKSAWEIVNKIFPHDYQKDDQASERARYPIYRSTNPGFHNDYICDLNDRLEINISEGNQTINIWIMEEKVKAAYQEETNCLSQQINELKAKQLTYSLYRDLYLLVSGVEEDAQRKVTSLADLMADTADRMTIEGYQHIAESYRNQREIRNKAHTLLEQLDAIEPKEA